MNHVLIVDDDASTLASLARAFRLAGYEATVCDSAVRAVELIGAGHFDIMLSDVVMPGKDGIALLEDLRKLGVAMPVIMISGQATLEMAVRATRLGAADFLEKPLSTDKLLLTVETALRLRQLEEENRQLRQRVGRHEIVGTSVAMMRVMAQVERVAASESRVAILGETGTGKELVARALHDRSPRRTKPFVSLNCAAVPADLIESELFGHEKGSFTGAVERHLGKFEQAHGGTLFLDEVGDMSPVMQAKLLRVLEDGEVERIGGGTPVAVNVRVLVATHRDLEELVGEGRFRADLFHRIFVFPLRLPPLRSHLDDIPLLVDHFARQVATRNGWKPRLFTEDAIERLKRYRWPGNVRELHNVVERLMLLCESQVDADAVELALPPETDAASRIPAGDTLARRMEAFERATILSELRRHGYGMTDTARALGLERSHLYKKCQHLGIDLRALRGRAADNPAS